MAFLLSILAAVTVSGSTLGLTQSVVQTDQTLNSNTDSNKLNSTQENLNLFSLSDTSLTALKTAIYGADKAQTILEMLPSPEHDGIFILTTKKQKNYLKQLTEDYSLFLAQPTFENQQLTWTINPNIKYDGIISNVDTAGVNATHDLQDFHISKIPTSDANIDSFLISFMTKTTAYGIAAGSEQKFNIKYFEYNKDKKTWSTDSNKSYSLESPKNLESIFGFFPGYRSTTINKKTKQELFGLSDERIISKTGNNTKDLTTNIYANGYDGVPKFQDLTKLTDRYTVDSSLSEYQFGYDRVPYSAFHGFGNLQNTYQLYRTKKDGTKTIDDYSIAVKYNKNFITAPGSTISLININIKEPKDDTMNQIVTQQNLFSVKLPNTYEFSTNMPFQYKLLSNGVQHFLFTSEIFKSTVTGDGEYGATYLIPIAKVDSATQPKPILVTNPNIDYTKPIVFDKNQKSNAFLAVDKFTNNYDLYNITYQNSTPKINLIAPSVIDRSNGYQLTQFSSDDYILTNPSNSIVSNNSLFTNYSFLYSKTNSNTNKNSNNLFLKKLVVSKLNNNFTTFSDTSKPINGNDPISNSSLSQVRLNSFDVYNNDQKSETNTYPVVTSNFAYVGLNVYNNKNISNFDPFFYNSDDSYSQTETMSILNYSIYFGKNSVSDLAVSETFTNIYIWLSVKDNLTKFNNEIWTLLSSTPTSQFNYLSQSEKKSLFDSHNSDLFSQFIDNLDVTDEITSNTTDLSKNISLASSHNATLLKIQFKKDETFLPTKWSEYLQTSKSSLQNTFLANAWSSNTALTPDKNYNTFEDEFKASKDTGNLAINVDFPKKGSLAATNAKNGYLYFYLKAAQMVAQQRETLSSAWDNVSKLESHNFKPINYWKSRINFIIQELNWWAGTQLFTANLIHNQNNELNQSYEISFVNPSYSNLESFVNKKIPTKTQFESQFKSEFNTWISDKNLNFTKTLIMAIVIPVGIVLIVAIAVLSYFIVQVKRKNKTLKQFRSFERI